MSPLARARRRFLAGFGLAALWPALGRAQEAPDELPKLIAELTGARSVSEGKVALTIPRIADNGNAVPLKIKVDSPMSADDHVKSVHVIAEKNPRPLVAAYFLGPRAGRAEIDTRIRLNGTQRVAAVATLSDGSRWLGLAEVDVTESACYDATNP